MTDITRDILVSCSRLGDCEVVFSNNFQLRDFMGATDLMDARMDRGLSLVEGQTVWGYKAQWLSQCHPGFFTSEEELSDILDALLGLEILWLEGKCSFQDSLLTCLWMQSPNAAENAGSPQLALFCMSLSVACALVSDLIRDARCTTFPDDFRPNLGVYAQRHLAEPLLERLASTLSSMPHSRVFLHFARLASWLSLIAGLKSLKDASTEQLDTHRLTLLISTIDELIDGYEPHTPSVTTFINPLFANTIGNGCLRKGTNPLPFIEAAERHKQILVDIMSIKFFDRPRTTSELIHQTLSARLRDSFGPVAMSFYSRYFIPRINDPFLDELVRVCSHSAPRQRRLIPKLVEKYGEVTPHSSTYMYWSCCLAEHYISLGFTLRLYTDHEFNESVMLLSLLAQLREQLESKLPTGEHLPLVSHQALVDSCSLKHLGAFTDQLLYDARFTARWSFILPLVHVASFQQLSERFSESGLQYYCTRLKSSNSVFLLP